MSEDQQDRLLKPNPGLGPQSSAPALQLEKALQDLKNKDAQYRSIFENVSDGLVVIDLDTGMLLAANPAYCQMHGYSYDEILTLNPLDLIPPQYHQKFTTFLTTVKSGQEFTCEANCRKPDGSIFCIEIKSVPFWYEGQFSSLSVIRDVTERKQMEMAIQEKNASLQQAMTELQQAQVQLVHSAKMSSLGQLVAGIAHEINNPLSLIYGNLSYIESYIQTLVNMMQCYQRCNLPQSPAIEVELAKIDLPFVQNDLAQTLRSMQTGAERISQIVLSLRNFSRIDESELKTVNIHDGIDNTLLMLAHRLGASPERPAIEVSREYSDLPIVQCYPSQLNQVFLNIMANAVDAIEACDDTRDTETPQARSGQIGLRTSMLNSEWVEIAIADNGPGIPESIQQKIFEPFFTTKPIGKGIGMGMAISYQIIVEQHGGRLECRSVTGTGTEIVVQIPISQSTQ